jgi:hypothetical protein
MSSFAPRAVLTRHHFDITENARGYWVAKDKQGLIGGVFRTQKDALRFALFEVAGDSAYVRVLPRTRPRSNQHPASSDQQRPPLELEEWERGRSAPRAADRIPLSWRRCSRIIALVFRVLYGTRRPSRSKTYGLIPSYDAYTAPGEK